MQLILDQVVAVSNTELIGVFDDNGQSRGEERESNYSGWWGKCQNTVELIHAMNRTTGSFQCYHIETATLNSQCGEWHDEARLDSVNR